MLLPKFNARHEKASFEVLLITIPETSPTSQTITTSLGNPRGEMQVLKAETT